MARTTTAVAVATTTDAGGPPSEYESIAGLYKVIATFESASGEPLSGSGYVARVFDKDPVVDDALGSSTLDEAGTASFLFSRLEFNTADTPLETKPDLYFTLERDDVEVFRSCVTWNLDFGAVDPVTQTSKERTQQFGPFRVS